MTSWLSVLALCFTCTLGVQLDSSCLANVHGGVGEHFTIGQQVWSHRASTLLAWLLGASVVMQAMLGVGPISSGFGASLETGHVEGAGRDWAVCFAAAVADDETCSGAHVKQRLARCDAMGVERGLASVESRL